MKRQVRQQLKGAFPHCQWCGGFGCMCCDEERRKHEERRSQLGAGDFQLNLQVLDLGREFLLRGPRDQHQQCVVRVLHGW
jgi:hypothetical protein